MVIYRIQDRYGRGPWKPGFSHKWVEDREDLVNLPPTLRDYRGMLECANAGYAMGYGCKTIDGLKRWITPKEYEMLRGFGYKAVKMEVSKVLMETDTQVLFARSLPLNLNVVVFRLYQKEEANNGTAKRLS